MWPAAVAGERLQLPPRLGGCRLQADGRSAARFPKPSRARPPGPGPQRVSPAPRVPDAGPAPRCRIAGAPQVGSALRARGNFPRGRIRVR